MQTSIYLERKVTETYYFASTGLIRLVKLRFSFLFIEINLCEEIS